MTEKANTIEQVFAKSKSKLFSFIRSFVSSKEDAEDILQEVFQQFINYSKYCVIEQINGWLFITAKNKIIDKSRKKKTVAFSYILNKYFDDDETFSFEDLIPSIDLNPEESFLRNKFNEELESALAKLPEEQRDVFLMTEIDGMSFNEISEITGLSINTLLSRKHYAVKQLKKKLIKYLDG